MLEFPKNSYSFDELMESVNVVVRPMAGAKNQTFQVKLGTMSHEFFAGDKVRINQVLINLLSNAIKYTPDGGEIKFEISDMGSTSSSVEKVRFVVADNGYGITDEFNKMRYCLYSPPFYVLTFDAFPSTKLRNL